MSSDGAHWVELMAPPQAAPKGGEVLWAQPSGLLRPWWRRIVTGQPHLAFEYTWSHTGLRIRLWVPGTVRLGLVRRAVEAAWPGARTRITQPGPLLPLGHTVSAGRLRLARPDVLPLRTDHPTDPLRALLQAATGMSEDEAACVQILARPATGSALRRARRQARHLKAGHGPGRLPTLAALLLHRAQPTATGKLDPDHAAAVRQSATKLSGSQWQCALTYAATCHPTTHRAQDVARGRAHALASAFGLYAERNHLVRTRLPHPEPQLSTRQFPPTRPALLSVAELAALAHLPADTDAPGVQRAGARSILPPPTVPEPASGNGVKPLGRSDTRARRGVGLAVADTRHHLHDDVMRAACLTLLKLRERTRQLLTLADVPRLLGEPAFRLRIIQGDPRPLPEGHHDQQHQRAPGPGP